MAAILPLVIIVALVVILYQHERRLDAVAMLVEVLEADLRRLAAVRITMPLVNDRHRTSIMTGLTAAELVGLAARVYQRSASPADLELVDRIRFALCGLGSQCGALGDGALKPCCASGLFCEDPPFERQIAVAIAAPKEARRA